MRRLLALLSVAALVTSCSGETVVSETTAALVTTAAPETTAAPVTTTAPATTSLPADAAPSEMRGTWRTEISADDVVFLTLNASAYGVTRGPNSAGGEISVQGDEIRFFNGSPCPDDGFYTWAREGESLTFTAADGGDPCGGRRPILGGVTYSLVSGG